MFCLVRTDREVPKHEGISFVLFSMDSEGVSTRPIELINGHSPFCQTFFDNVRVSGQFSGQAKSGLDGGQTFVTARAFGLGGSCQCGYRRSHATH